MKIIKEISANQALSLLFTSLGSEASISFNDIDMFFDLLKEIIKENNGNFEYCFGINMPMNDNFDKTLFEEITNGENKGKIKLIKTDNPKTGEVVKEKMIKQIICLTGNDKEFMNNIKLTIELYNKQYIENNPNIINLSKEKTIFEKIKGLVKTR